MAKRCVSVQNACAAAYTSNAAARNYVGWSHFTVAVDSSDLRTIDSNWVSTNAGESSNTNSFTILGYELQIGSDTVTVAAGQVIPVCVKRINATGTTATGLHGLRRG